MGISAILLASLLASCTTAVHDGGRKLPDSRRVRLFLPPFLNATEDEHAGQALTELMATALMERGYSVIQTEPATSPARAETAGGSAGNWLETARSAGASHLLLGIVLEHRYKTDLDGDPVVGISVRVVDTRDGLTRWQGSSAKVCVWFASLTTAGQRAARDLAARMPLEHWAESPPATSAFRGGRP